MTATMTHDAAKIAAEAAAKRIVDAVTTFSPWIRLNLATALAAERSDTLRTVGESLLGKDPIASMADGLLVDVFLGDLEDIGPKLGDAEPWATIREALEDVAEAWHASHPGIRTRRDFAARWRRWEQEAKQRALDASDEPVTFPYAPPEPRIVTRLCRRCSMPATSSIHWYCDECRGKTASARAGRGPRIRKQAKTSERGYTGQHAARRKQWTPRVKAGGVACGRCGNIIPPDAPWDLSHPGDDKSLEPVPWCRRCNRQYAATVTKRRRRRDNGQ
jgi:hypothetical protein